MPFYPIFLSVVYVIRNQQHKLESILSDTGRHISSLVSDYEIIVVDNASNDESISVLKNLTGEKGLPNLQVYALTQEIDIDTATWVGLENALGDFFAVIDPLAEDIAFLPEMLEKSVLGAEVVFANNTQKPKKSVAYRIANAAFNAIYKFSNGIDMAKDAPQYRILSKRVVNLILQYPQPGITYRHLPVTGGFARINLQYSSAPKMSHPKRLGESVDRGINLLVSTTKMPMRLVTMLSLFGAVANLVYSIYVVAIGIFKADVSPGWISLSLQQSGMFLLISLVLLVLGEYIIQMAKLSNEGPPYHIGQMFTSAIMTRREKLNIEEVAPITTSTGTSNPVPARVT